MTEVKPIRQAATVVLARDGASGMEVLLLKRSSRSSFMANVIVYPGGAVDAGDHALAQSPRVRSSRGLWADDWTRAHAIAALREAYEESGMLVAEFGRPVSVEALDAERRRLLAGERSFDAILEDFDAHLSLDAIWYFDRWVTPSWETKRYDALFFLVRAPEGQIARCDETETVEGDWYRPEDALAAYRRREMLLAPPTWATLRDLSGFASVDDAAEFARAATPSPILPHFTQLEGEAEGVVLLPGDGAYPGFDDVDTTLRGPARRTRIGMQDGLWVEHPKHGATDRPL